MSPALCRILGGSIAVIGLAVLTISGPSAVASAQSTPSRQEASPTPIPRNVQSSPPAAAPLPVGVPAVVSQESDRERWVQNFLVTEQWSGPDQGAEFFGWLRKFSYLRVESSAGNRLYVFNPRTNGFAYVDASAVGPSGAPPADYLEPMKELGRVNMPGRLVGRTSIYADPVADEGVWLRNAGHNTPVFVEAEVQGEEGGWYRLDTGEFVSADNLRLPPPTAARYPGKWIDADLNDPTIVTAYEGDRPVASALAIRGVAAWRTPVGTFTIGRRVANETMSSEGLGIPRNAPGGYYLQNVLFTQYFTGDGASIHYNYWSSNFGYAGSHGCLGMTYDDALWFWNWADYGTPLVIHY